MNNAQSKVGGFDEGGQLQGEGSDLIVQRQIIIQVEWSQVLIQPCVLEEFLISQVIPCVKFSKRIVRKVQIQHRLMPFESQV